MLSCVGISTVKPVTNNKITDNINNEMACNCNDNVNSISVSSGPQGPQGERGEPGYNAFGTTDAIVVSLGGNQYRVPIEVDGIQWPIPGQMVFIEDCGYYEVDSVVVDDYIVVNDPVYSGNTMAPAIAASGKKVGPAGIIGLPGSSGAPGIDGNMWHSAAGVPSGATGEIGDYYLNTTNGDIYEKTGVSTWTATGGNIKGPTGATGPTGPQGPAYTSWTEYEGGMTSISSQTDIDPGVTVGPSSQVVIMVTLNIQTDIDVEVTITPSIGGVPITALQKKHYIPAASAAIYTTITTTGIATTVTGGSLLFSIELDNYTGTATITSFNGAFSFQ